MTFRHALVISVSAALMSWAPLLAADSGSQVGVAKTDLEWKDMGNGETASPVAGNMEMGPCRFFLNYPVGQATPKHHHDADHCAKIVSGMITLTVEGKDHELELGAYFPDDEGAARAKGPWNVVMQK